MLEKKNGYDFAWINKWSTFSHFVFMHFHRLKRPKLSWRRKGKRYLHNYLCFLPYVLIVKHEAKY